MNPVHDAPLFEVGHTYRNLFGFGWVQLPRCETPLIGDQGVSTQSVADELNRIYENADSILTKLRNEPHPHPSPTRA